MSFTVANALSWWFRECPDALCWSVEDEPVSYRELYDWSGRVGAYLQSQGIAPGDRITTMAQNGLEYAVLAMAMMRIGAIATPINFRSTARELRETCSLYEPVAVFTDSDRAGVASDAIASREGTKLLALDELQRFRYGEPVMLVFEPTPDTPVFVIGTSGSTGQPKGVIYNHRMIMSYAAELAISTPRCAHGASVLSVGPFSSSSGYLLLMQFTALGVTMYIESKFQAERALDLLTTNRITIFQATPIFFERIAALEKFATADFSNLYFAQVGGSTVSTALLDAWRRKGVVLRQAYGSTEAGGAWAARDATALTQPEKCGPGGVFTRFFIIDNEGKPAAPGQPGEIIVRGAAVTPGYWNNPEATAEALQDGSFRTGDLGVLDEQGNLTFIDRIKDIVISGGLNVSTAEVEGVIREVPGVEEVAVIRARDADFGETPLAVIYSPSPELSPQIIVEHCNRQLANYKVPRYVVIESQPLPRLPSGKLSKRALSEKYKNADAELQKVR